MSDYRDILLSALKAGKTLDSCGLDEQYYDFGLYTDLCGMSVEDAIKSITDGCCGGNKTGSTKTDNPIIISAEKNSDGKYVVKAKAAYPVTSPVVLSFSINGEKVNAIIPVGSSEATVENVLLDTQYAVIGAIDIATSDEIYKYTAVNKIADGLFVLTYKIDGKTVHEVKIQVGSNIEKFEPEEKTGYLFKGWVPEEPDVMPENDLTLNGEYEAIPYYIVFKDITTGDIRVECFYEKTINKPTASEKEGNEFKGWFMEDGKEVPDVLNFIPEGEVEANPLYEPKDYTLYYQTFDGQEWKKFSVKYDTTIEYLAEGPSRVGYDFTEWEGKPENDKMPAKDVILKALYEIHKWNLIYSIIDDENPDFTGFTYENIEYNSEITEKTSAFAEKHKTDEGKYEFAWDGAEHEITNMPDNSLTIKAIRKIVAHTLRFESEEGELYSSITQNYNSDISIVVKPEKEGYSFTGWDKGEIPSKMPAEDLTYISRFDINKHTINFIINNEKDSTDTGTTVLNVAYATQLETIVKDFAEKYPNVKGEYSFSWEDEASIPSIMPDNDVTIKAKYEAVEHTLTFMKDNTVYKELKGKYNTIVESVEAPEKEGYKFTGWDKEIPSLFPNADEVFNAQFEILQYTVTINNEDGTVLSTIKVNYGTEIKAIEAPEKEGYTFVEYVSDYVTVPAQNITIIAKYIINRHNVIYYVDDEKVNEKEYEYHAAIDDYKYEKEGYTISAWDGLPEDMLMPDKDIEVKATSTVNEYKVTFFVDETEYSSVTVAYGEVINTPSENPTKEGYTFIKWVDVPATMPAKNLEINAEFNINSYELIFKNEEETITSYTVDYNTELASYSTEAKSKVAEKEGYTFSWDTDLPATMPANNLTIVGSYKEKVAGQVYYDVIKTGTSLNSDIITSLLSVNETELEGDGKSLYFTIPSALEEYNAAKTKWSDDTYENEEKLDNGEITQEEFDENKKRIDAEWEKYNKEHTFIPIFIASATSSFTFLEDDGSDVTKDFVEQSVRINIDGKEYKIYLMESGALPAEGHPKPYLYTVKKN